MVRLLVRAGVLLLASAIGLLVAMLVVDGMSIDAAGFLLVVVIFTGLQSVLAPFIAKVAARNAPAVLGAVGLITTYLSLLVTTLVSDGLAISGTADWMLATLIVWLVTMLATLLLPIVLVKLGVQAASARRSAD